MNRSLIAVALFFFSGLASGRAGTVLYSQPATPLPSAYSVWESESAAGTVNARTYDNFSLSSAGDIGAVTWEGSYIDQSTPSDNPAQPNSTAFEISFWSDDHGAPGSELATSTVQSSAISTTKLGTVMFDLSTGGNIAGGDVTIPVYSYRASLSIPFAASAGTKYWISILSDAPAVQPAWGWYSASGGDNSSIQDFAGSRYTRSQDRAFTLEAASLPVATVQATTPDAHFGAGGVGVFTFKLSAAQATPTVIHYAAKGSAVNGHDYDLLTGLVKIKPGATSAVVRVVAKDTLKPGGSKKVKLVLELGTEYTVGKAEVAIVTIVDPRN